MTSGQDNSGRAEPAETVRQTLADAVFGLDQAARMARDATVRRDFAELAERARAALGELDHRECR